MTFFAGNQGGKSSLNPPNTPQNPENSIPRREQIRRILREETQDDRRVVHPPHATDAHWIQVTITETGERCTNENTLYRILSNSKQSVGGVSNRVWWNRHVIRGFYHYTCAEGSQTTRFCLLIQPSPSVSSLHTRFRKTVGFSADIKTEFINELAYPKSRKGFKSFQTPLSGTFPETDDGE